MRRSKNVISLADSSTCAEPWIVESYWDNFITSIWDCLWNQFQQILLFLSLSLIIHEWPTWFAVDLHWLPIDIRKCSTSAKIRNITMNSYEFFCSISKKSSHYQNASHMRSMTHENPAKSCRLLQTIGMWISQLHERAWNQVSRVSMPDRLIE